jgi:hypothetical protein
MSSKQRRSTPRVPELETTQQRQDRRHPERVEAASVLGRELRQRVVIWSLASFHPFSMATVGANAVTFAPSSYFSGKRGGTRTIPTGARRLRGTAALEKSAGGHGKREGITHGRCS